MSDLKMVFIKILSFDKFCFWTVVIYEMLYLQCQNSVKHTNN